jgi:hypothetical protein
MWLPGGRCDQAVHLFQIEVTELALIRPSADHVVIEWWRQGAGTKRIERR